MRSSQSESRLNGRALTLALLLVLVSISDTESFCITTTSRPCSSCRPAAVSPQESCFSGLLRVQQQGRKGLGSSQLYARYNEEDDQDLDSDENDDSEDSSPRFSRKSTDVVVAETSLGLRRISWLSGWAQIILTVTSAVILIFAKNAVTGIRDAQVNFLLAGSGKNKNVYNSLALVWF